LASISLTKLVTSAATDYSGTTGVFDFEQLFEVTKVITRNLNRVIDRNYYPIEESRK
jgi:ribonucleotide reductase alpha subunit